MLRLAAVVKKRQYHVGLALFLCLLAGACAPGDSASAGPTCLVESTDQLQKIAVEHVYDGDTLRLRGGAKLRLIGINTPELGRNGRPDEPLAREARTGLQRLVAGGFVWLLDGEDPRDKYNRRLAYAFDHQGNSLSAQLVRQGLGFHVAISPNYAYADCLQAQERFARDAAQGVWSEDRFAPLAARELGRSQGGFLRIRDRVTHVSFKDNGWWVQLGGKVGLQIKRADQGLFSRSNLAGLEGRVIEARGWLVPMQGDWWMMQLGHPSMLEQHPFGD